jgi:predicted ATPase
VAAELAYHFEEGAAWARAITYLRVVAETAGQRYAYREAATTLQRALALVPHLPETPARTQQSLTLHLALGAALLMTKGHTAPEVEYTYTQARALCQQMGATPELVPALFDLWRFYIARPQLQSAREFGETLLGLAQPADDPALEVLAHYALGSTWLRLGALPAARRHLEAGIARSMPDPQRAPGFRMLHELGVACRVNAAQTLWLLGYPEQALVRLREALAGAHELSHPFSQAYVRCWAAFVAQFCRDVSAVYAHAEAAGVVATAHGFLRTLTPGTWGKIRAAGVVATMQGFPLWAAMGRILHGWALAMQGQSAEGLAQVRQGIATMRATGAALFVPYMCTLLADVAARLGHPADGLQALTEAHTLVEQHEERWWEAEVARLRGTLLLRQPQTLQAEAEAWLQRALAVARGQEAKALELRAAMSLSRLWQQQGKREEARSLLAPVYGWFTEGFNTADLQEAKSLLDELGR